MIEFYKKARQAAESNLKEVERLDNLILEHERLRLEHERFRLKIDAVKSSENEAELAKALELLT